MANPGTKSNGRMTARSGPTRKLTGPLLRRPGTAVLVRRPLANSIRTMPSGPRPNSSHPAVMPKIGRPRSVVHGDTCAVSASTGGVDDRGLGVVGVVLVTTDRVDAGGGGTGFGVASGDRGCSATATTTTAITAMSSSGHHLVVRTAELSARAGGGHGCAGPGWPPYPRRRSPSASPDFRTRPSFADAPDAAIFRPHRPSGKPPVVPGMPPRRPTAGRRGARGRNTGPRSRPPSATPCSGRRSTASLAGLTRFEWDTGAELSDAGIRTPFRRNWSRQIWGPSRRRGRSAISVRR